MTSSLRRSFFLFISILLLSLVGFSIVSGKAPWLDEASVSERVALPPRSELINKNPLPEAALKLSVENISVENIRFATTADAAHEFFMKENEITIECTLRHEFSSFHSYTVVIKTDREEIFRKTVTPQSTEQTLIFSASYFPKTSGTLPVACRTDLENTVRESDERDNRLVKFLLIF